MSDYTSKLNLYKVDPAIDGEDTFNIKSMMNDNWDKIDEKVGNMDEKLSGVEDNANNYNHPDTHDADMIRIKDESGKFTGDNVEDALGEVGSQLADIAYKQATINGREIQLTVPSFTFTNNKYISIEITADIPEGDALTVKVNSDMAVALKDIDSNPLTSMDKGFYTYIVRTGTPNFFLLAPKGADIQSIYGAYDGSDEIDLGNVKQGQYVYSNHSTKLKFFKETTTLKDHTVPIEVMSGNNYTSHTESRPIVLDNGHIIIATKNNGNEYKLYKSIDGGDSWINIKTVSGINNLRYISIATDGKYIYLVRTSDNTTCRVVVYDEEGNEIQNHYSYNSAQAMGICSIDISPDKTKLFIAFTATISSRPNSFNLFVEHNTIGSDGRIKQDRVDMLTNDSNTTITTLTCSALYNSNNQAMVVFSHRESSVFKIYYDIHISGSSWNHYTVYQSSSRANISPQIIQQKYGSHIGRLWCVWSSKESPTNHENYNIRIKYSDDNGVSWNDDGGIINSFITNEESLYQDKPSLGEDSQGNLYITWQGITSLSFNNIKLIKRMDNNSSWGAIETIDSSDLVGSTNPTIARDKHDFEKPLMAIGRSNEVLFYGKFSHILNQQTIPSIENGINGQGDTQFQAPSTGILKSYGIDPQQIIGFISKKPLGWTKVDLPKKVVKGVAIGSSTTKSFNLYYESTKSMMYIQIDMSTLGFIPSSICIHREDLSETRVTHWDKESFYDARPSNNNHGNCTWYTNVFNVPYSNGVMYFPVAETHNSGTNYTYTIHGGEE